MKPYYLMLLVLMLPFVLADTPAGVEDFCTGFDMQQCNEHSAWFDHEDCEVQIRCNAVIDVEAGFEFKECQTMLRFIMDNCTENPSSLCFNNIAYDISHSETCDCGGVRFKKIDSCGNALDWGECIDINSCDEKTVTPHTGAAVVVKENCDYISQDCSQDEEYQYKNRPWVVTMENPSEENVEEIEQPEEPEQTCAEDACAMPVPLEEEEQTQPEQVAPGEVDEQPQPATNTTPEVKVEGKKTESNKGLMIFTAVIAILFLITILAWIYVSYFKK